MPENCTHTGRREGREREKEKKDFRVRTLYFRSEKEIGAIKRDLYKCSLFKSPNNAP